MTKGADGSYYRTKKPVPTSVLQDELLEKFPKHASETKLLHTTAHKLSSCLSGQADPLALLFRDSTARKLLKDVYTNAPMFKTGTLLLAQYLSTVLQRLGGRRELKILELGAGTGGTSKHVIKTLAGLGPKYEFSYTFTDLSSSLVAAARRKFAKWPLMHYTVLDIEKDPSPELTAPTTLFFRLTAFMRRKFSCIHAPTSARCCARTVFCVCRSLHGTCSGSISCSVSLKAGGCSKTAASTH